MTGSSRACRPHRRLLEDLIERGERGPGTPAALEHLERCDACERELTELALTVATLRRAGRELRLAPVPRVGPARIAALARKRRSPWAWRLQLSSLLTGAAIAAVIVGPQFSLPGRATSDALVGGQPAATATWRVAESRLAAAPDTPSFAAAGTLPPRYPEGLSRPWKEVFPTDATPPEFEPS